MSLIKLQGNASGTGAFTIAAPNGNTDRTLTLPDATGTVNVSGLANEVPAGSAGAPAIYPTGDSNTGIFFPAADTIAFAEGGAEVARFDSSGRLLVGTTNISGRLTVASPDNSGSTNIITAISNNLGQSVSMTFTGLKANSGAGIGFVVNESTGALTITSTGLLQSLPTYNNTSGGAANVGVAADGAFYRSTSSLRYKNSVQDATHGLTELLTLRPVTYKGNNDGDTVFGGLIAEEVHEAGLTEFVQYAEDGSPDALAYSNMVSLCIKAIQEQQAQIEDLKAEVAALKGASA